jgi:hypothetical protein
LCISPISADDDGAANLVLRLVPSACTSRVPRTCIYCYSHGLPSIDITGSWPAPLSSVLCGFCYLNPSKLRSHILLFFCSFSLRCSHCIFDFCSFRSLFPSPTTLLCARNCHFRALLLLLLGGMFPVHPCVAGLSFPLQSTKGARACPPITSYSSPSFGLFLFLFHEVVHAPSLFSPISTHLLLLLPIDHLSLLYRSLARPATCLQRHPAPPSP